MEPETQSNKPRPTSRQKLIIGILGVLLVLALGALVWRVVYILTDSRPGATVVVPDNQLGTQPTPGPTGPAATAPDPTGTQPEPTGGTQAPTAPPAATEPAPKAATISLYKGQLTDNEKFVAENLLPGDVEEKYFQVKVSHEGRVVVYFQSLVTEQSKGLGQVLHLEVTHPESGQVLYSGPFQDATGQYPLIFLRPASGWTTAYYKVAVSLPTSIGNEYQGAHLMADFSWYVKDEDAMTPPTGDLADPGLWAAVMVLALASMGLLLVLRRATRKEDGHENP